MISFKFFNFFLIRGIAFKCPPQENPLDITENICILKVLNAESESIWWRNVFLLRFCWFLLGNCEVLSKFYFLFPRNEKSIILKFYKSYQWYLIRIIKYLFAEFYLLTTSLNKISRLWLIRVAVSRVGAEPFV